MSGFGQMENHAGGIAMVTFVVALALSLGYYQFVYVPQANAKPILPEEILNPSGVTKVTIVDGAVNEQNGRFFAPQEVRATLGVSNKVAWTNEDSTPHTVTTDDGYVDQISGPFDSLKALEEEGGFVMPGKTFEFVFTKPGEYLYHCEPHPFMKGKVEVVESFA